MSAGPFLAPPCAEPGCARRGRIGRGVNLGQGRIGVWFCSIEHERQALERRSATTLADVVAQRAPPQGRLL